MRPSSAGSLPVDRLSSSPPSLHLLHLLLLLLLVPPSLSIQTERAESHDEFSCEPIGLRMCQDLPYNTTFMPNLLNHYDQQTAALAMEPFHPMVNLQCSPDMRMFLCALYAPVCTEYGRVSLPCRGLCRRSQSDCRGLMEMFGLAWPDEMDCSRFPECEEAYPRQEDLLTTSDDAADQASMTVQRDYGFWCPRELKVDPELGYSFLGRRDCSAPCPSMFFSRQELSAARYAIGGVSIVCLSATLFTFLTFLIDVTRFRYPERPIIFYAVCYVMVSLVFFLGFLLEDRVACNAASPAHFRAATITQGSHNKICTLFFMVLYFFTMAGNVWWVILTVTWFLAAVPKWGSEAIEKKALLFHACAWGLPGALTVTLLALNKIEGDGVSGVCFVGLYDVDALRWFVLAPLCLNVAVGVSLLLVGIVALNRVRMEIPLEKENQTKLVKFMIRIGVFSVLYLVPLLTVIGCHLYEHAYRRAWETTWVRRRCRSYHIPCPYKVEDSHEPALVLFLIKYLMMLVVGVPSVFWVGSKKTCFEWASFLHGNKRKDSGVNESRQVLQEQPDLAQSLLRDPNTPIIRKSRGTSTQGTSTHASSTQLAVLDDPDEPIRPHPSLPASSRSKPSSLHSKVSYHGSLNRSRDNRHDAVAGYSGSEVRSYHGSMPRLDHPLSTHSSLHRLDGQSARGSQRDAAEAPPPLVTHGAAATAGPPANDDNGTSA
ncbi:frizzled-3 [Gadus morhua]|uniref:Frizzled-3-like n=1 Tax=Gadus morhua TaxID=8049 RepID=A0A8C5CYJ8_GADMO|nr:frizzled-3-like [Gadus morhua]XP_030233537.1 frizzled-3-like [Gadus morhua]